MCVPERARVCVCLVKLPSDFICVACVTLPEQHSLSINLANGNCNLFPVRVRGTLGPASVETVN